MLWPEVGMLLREPFERDFGFTASARRLLDGAEPLSVL
jgi:hypothetical protein